jgi:hypothetical protein
VDNEWKYQKRIISFTVIPNHKVDTVGRKIEEVLRDWGIRSVSSITVDNASSSDVAVPCLNKKIKTMNGNNSIVLVFLFKFDHVLSLF